jgi:hypothetical protein
MGDAAKDFERWQDSSCEDIDKDWNGEQGPGEESPVPSLEDIVVIIQDYQSLDQGAEQERGLCTSRDPCKYRDPTLQ